MVSCLARLIIKYCTINLMSSFEIWTGIYLEQFGAGTTENHYNINLHRVHVPKHPFLLDASKVIRMEQDIPSTSAIYIMVAHHVQGVVC